MQPQRTEQQEIIDQLQLLNAQLNPMRVILPLSFWVTALLAVFVGIPSFFLLLASGGFDKPVPPPASIHKHVAKGVHLRATHN